MPWSSFLKCWVVSQFFYSPLHHHQEALSCLFTFCHRVVSSAYLRLLIFLLAILIQACASSSLAFLMMSKWSRSVVSDPQWPHGLQPTRLLHPWNFPGKSTRVGCQLPSPMYSAYKLNKQGDNIQPWHTPFPIWNQSVVPCPILTVASWPASISQALRRTYWISISL